MGAASINAIPWSYRSNDNRRLADEGPLVTPTSDESKNEPLPRRQLLSDEAEGL